MLKLRARLRVRWGVASLLAVAVVLVIGTLMAVTTVLDVRRARGIFREEADRRGHLLASALKDVLFDTLYFADVERLTQVAILLSMEPEVQYVRVFRPDGRLVVDTAQGRYPLGAIDESSLGAVRAGQTVLMSGSEGLKVVTAIESGAGGEIIGGATFGVSLAPVEAEIRAITIQRIWQAVVLILVGAVVTVLIARRTARPLKVLAAKAGEMGRGNLDSPIDVRGPAEIVELGDALERMRVDLQRYYTRLAALVVERTEDLETINRELQTEMEEREQAERALALRAEELARSNADLEQFAYVASHDLQEPLRAIVGFTSILERRYGGKLDADADSLMERTVGAAKRMRALVNDLLTYSRVGRVWDGLQPTDFEVVVDQEIDNLRAAIDESSAVVRRGRLPTTMANPMLLGQVLGNLIGNAIKFRGDAAPRIHVSAERKNDEWEFSVRDNGIGLEPEYAERIFVIFQRLHSRTEYEGTGIGLAVCKKAVEQMGGRIWVESELGRGSTFFFTVPMKADEIPAVAHARPNDGAITLSGGDRL